MKHFSWLSMVTLIACLALMTACNQSADEELLELPDQNTSRFGKSKGKVHKPFKANFFTKRNYSNAGQGFCTEAPFLDFNYQVGGGTGTHLGKFKTEISFCGSGFDYKNGEGYFAAANGDTLFFLIPSPGQVGHVVPFNHPVYEAQFQDPFAFNGGTGRFAGATGSGTTDSFVDLFDDDGNFILEHRTDHKFTGTLILPKKK